MVGYSPLINSEKTVTTTISKCNIRMIYFILFIIVGLQGLCLAYIIILGQLAQDINLFDFNKTETNEYIDKFKIIINQVCSTMIQC
jgi:hypothetical protein